MLVAALVLVSAVVVYIALVAHRLPAQGTSTTAAWPQQGQAAYTLSAEDTGAVRTGVAPAEDEVPIASIAKVMTAYVVLQRQPLGADEDRPALTVTPEDVADTRRRADNDESVVAVSTGERLTERQALQALLLPSANNVAVMLAREVSGSVAAFVHSMNVTAARLGMTHTVYTDPSGLDPQTVSTAADQVVLMRHALRLRTFADVIAMPDAELPVAGTVHNTNRLLGRDGMLGGKTGSDDDAGGCFVFAARRIVAGRSVVMIGAVLGQRGGPLIAAALKASQRLMDGVSTDGAPNS